MDSEESEARAGNGREKIIKRPVVGESRTSSQIRARFPADVKQVARTADQSGQRSHGFTRMIGLVLNPLRSIKRTEKENTKRNDYFIPFPSPVALNNTSAKQQQR